MTTLPDSTVPVESMDSQARPLQSGKDGRMTAQWTLLTSHGHVLFYLGAEPDATVRQITNALGISERRVIAVLHDLEDAGMITSRRVGVRKHYEVNQDAHFRHPTLSHVRLGDVMETLCPKTEGPPMVRWRG